MQHNLKRGFTLIELLVVIAIIGILSAVVLASLNTARSKGNDASIQSNLSAVRTQAQLYYEDVGGNSYGTEAVVPGDCAASNNMFSDSNISRAVAAADTANGGGTIICNVSVDGTEYAVSAQMVADSSKSWCIDSTSVGKMIDGVNFGATDTVCP